MDVTRSERMRKMAAEAYDLRAKMDATPERNGAMAWTKMTKREHFAGLALPGATERAQKHGIVKDSHQIARIAVFQADALLKALAAEAE